MSAWKEARIAYKEAREAPSLDLYLFHCLVTAGAPCTIVRNDNAIYVEFAAEVEVCLIREEVDGLVCGWRTRKPEPKVPYVVRNEEAREC